VGGGRKPLAGPDREIETVRRRRQRAGPLGIERARRLVGEVEVEDQGAGVAIATEVGALGRVEQIAARAVRLGPVRAVAERQEQPAGIALHPVDLEPSRAVAEGDRHRPEPAERHDAAGADGQVDRGASAAGTEVERPHAGQTRARHPRGKVGRARNGCVERLDGHLESERRVMGEMVCAERRPPVGGHR
jgi:hypothetical protein